jgi:dihydrofolate synthase/folylpolyglutamate synthase
MHISPAYQAALDYIFSYVDFSKTHAQNLDPANFDLPRVEEFLERLGDPQRTYPCIHVAGTKGKGSVSALCAAALQAAGLKTGLYTSPHLLDFSERIQVDRNPIPPEEVVTLLEEMKPAVESIPGISSFEIMTALAFLYFARSKVDIAVVEVGLGGRLDATNVVTPLVSVITSISLDHTPILGNTLAEIAGEKAGIIKNGIPVVCSPQPQEAFRRIDSIARERQASVTLVGRDTRFLRLDQTLQGQHFHVWKNPGNRKSLFIPLVGTHQLENAATAWTALGVVAAAGIPLDEGAIQKGFASVDWPGRFQILQREPFVILDAAHNPDSARRLAATLDELLPDRPITLVCGFSGDKNLPGFLEALRGRLQQAVATRAAHPRAMPPAELAEKLAGLGIPVQAADAIENALPAAFAVTPSEGILLVTGSVFLVGAALAVWPRIPERVSSANVGQL